MSEVANLNESRKPEAVRDGISGFRSQLADFMSEPRLDRGAKLPQAFDPPGNPFTLVNGTQELQQGKRAQSETERAPMALAYAGEVFHDQGTDRLTIVPFGLRNKQVGAILGSRLDQGAMLNDKKGTSLALSFENDFDRFAQLAYNERGKEGVTDLVGRINNNSDRYEIKEVAASNWTREERATADDPRSRVFRVYEKESGKEIAGFSYAPDVSRSAEALSRSVCAGIDSSNIASISAAAKEILAMPAGERQLAVDALKKQLEQRNTLMGAALKDVDQDGKPDKLVMYVRHDWTKSSGSTSVEFDQNGNAKAGYRSGTFNPEVPLDPSATLMNFRRSGTK